jgi:hypothetical protein
MSEAIPGGFLWRFQVRGMFFRVDVKQAGPNALGILVPQQTKTLVIVRPRALAWDLLPARWNGDSTNAPRFCWFTRDEATGAARRILRTLETAVTLGANPVQTFGNAEEERLQIWLRTEEFVWIVCRRSPGEEYRPMIFPTREDAEREAEKIAAIVWPTADARQEYYFNTQNFS